MDSLEIDASRPEHVESSSSAKAQVIDCCALLKLAADHASTSDFIRQVNGFKSYFLTTRCRLRLSPSCDCLLTKVAQCIRRCSRRCVGLLYCTFAAPQCGALVQDVVKLLHNRLERSSSLADMLLGQHLGDFLQQPQALQLLLTSLPSAATQQRLLYKSLCHLLQSGASWPAQH